MESWEGQWKLMAKSVVPPLVHTMPVHTQRAFTHLSAASFVCVAVSTVVTGVFRVVL